MPIKDQISSSALRVIQALQKEGYEAYLVGGAVRDIILGRIPKDYDISTNATPNQVKKVFGRRCRIIGRRFRLAHVYTKEMMFEVSTFRRTPSEEERKGRSNDDGTTVWRDNEFGTIDEDAERRDYTANAIFYDPLSGSNTFHDPMGGVVDIEKGIVRCIGDPDQRILEDPVRMIRALKLVAEYGFKLEPELKKSILINADKISLSSQARLLEEIFKILKKPYSAETFDLLHGHGLLQYLLPLLDKNWKEAIGKDVKELLHTRDVLLNNGEVFPSRVTGIGIMVFPFVRHAFCDDLSKISWKNFSGIDKEIQSIIRDFLVPYTVPRYIVAKIRDVLLSQPKLIVKKNKARMTKHPEYNRTLDLLKVYATAYERDDLIKFWPTENSKKFKRRPNKENE
ncbi:MAG: hypothetical protein MK193_08455 [Lentisphaeria bacterium]|nr:hypothetical protein [Lentisphaeria bacterium]